VHRHELSEAEWKRIEGLLPVRPGPRSKRGDTGVDAFELNLFCPHGLPERKMGMAMGENPDLVREVVGWVKEVSKIPAWAKMTPNAGDITQPAGAALAAGANGIAAVNTILSIAGVDLKTLPTV
jgi:dihydroorotate dehydrogenase